MNTLLKSIYRRLLPAPLRRHVDLYAGLRADGPTDLSPRRVLVLAPHPDDDIASCGGTAYGFHQRGAEIHAVYLTDGSEGNEHIHARELAARRQEEARAGAILMGIDHLTFLGHPDSRLAVTPETVAQMRGILDSVRPDVVMLPFHTDAHRDHAATAAIFAAACRGGAPAITCYAYSFWSPLPMHNLAVDITACADLKRRALGEHRSPRSMPAVIEGCFGINRYYSLLAHGQAGFAEVFLVCSAAEFTRLADVLA